MSSDLDEIFERLDHCADEISSLDATVAEYLQRAFRQRPAPTQQVHFALANPSNAQQSVAYDLYAKVTEKVPTPIKSKTSMVLNSIRASLDSLACRLAIRNGQDTDKVYFPISASAGAFQSDGMKKIAKLSVSDQTTIAALNPYQGGDDVLFRLHRADIKGKHIDLCAAAATSGGFSLAGVIEAQSGILMSDCMIGDTHVPNLKYTPPSASALPNIGVEVKVASGIPSNLPAHLIPTIIFQEPPPVAGHEALTLLRQSLARVREIATQFK